MGGDIFFCGGASMQRILVDARHKERIKAGGELKRGDLSRLEPAVAEPCVDLLAMDEALEKLEELDKRKADQARICVKGIDRCLHACQGWC
jgi:hypothetical protein